MKIKNKVEFGLLSKSFDRFADTLQPINSQLKFRMQPLKTIKDAIQLPWMRSGKTCTDRLTDKQIDRQIEGQIDDRQTDRWTDRQIVRQTDRPMDR